MQVQPDIKAAVRKPFGLAWRALFFGLFIIAVSLVLSVFAVRAVETLVL